MITVNAILLVRSSLCANACGLKGADSDRKIRRACLTFSWTGFDCTAYIFMYNFYDDGRINVRGVLL